MAISVKLSDEIVAEAKNISIEYWAKIGKIAEENPDLTYDFIKNILIAKQESEAGDLKPYDFDSV